MHAWFDVHSLTDIHERQEEQVEGLRESVRYVLDVVESEIQRLDGRAERVFLGGFSQGMATALWVLLCSSSRRLGGLLGFSGWLPCAHQIEETINAAKHQQQQRRRRRRQRQHEQRRLGVEIPH